MRLAFFGTPSFAVPALDALVEAGHELVVVVAGPDRPSGRGHRLQAPPVALRARELGLDLRQPRGIRRGPFAGRLSALRPELAVVVAYGRILPPAVLAAPSLGCLNAHPSPLPRWRGAAPIERAVMAGDRRTAVCTMWMEEGLDTGPVLLRRDVQIGPDEMAFELRRRLAPIAAGLVVETLARLGEIQARPQDEEGVTLAPPIRREEGVLDWSRPAARVHDRVRALQPWPGTGCGFRGGTLKVRRTRVLGLEGRPGQVLEARRRLVIACGHGAVEVLEGQLPGRRVLPGAELARGARIRVGEVFS